MNEHVVLKMTNFCVVKLSNSPAITCVPRLELDHFESQPDSPIINQRLPKIVTDRHVNNYSTAKFLGKLISGSLTHQSHQSRSPVETGLHSWFNPQHEFTARIVYWPALHTGQTT